MTLLTYHNNICILLLIRSLWEVFVGNYGAKFGIEKGRLIMALTRYGHEYILLSLRKYMLEDHRFYRLMRNPHPDRQRQDKFAEFFLDFLKHICETEIDNSRRQQMGDHTTPELYSYLDAVVFNKEMKYGDYFRWYEDNVIFCDENTKHKDLTL